jgi:hypothetical protein
MPIKAMVYCTGHRKYKDKTSTRAGRDTWTGADQRGGTWTGVDRETWTLGQGQLERHGHLDKGS